MVKKRRVTKSDMFMKLVTVKDLKKFNKFCKFFQKFWLNLVVHML